MTTTYKTILKILIFLAAFVPHQLLFSQQQTFGVGTYMGGGFIQGNLPSLGSFNGSVFIDFTVPFINGLSSRLSFVYATDVNILLPQNNNRYSPFIKGFSLKEIYTSNISKNIFFEGGIGPLILNDRTFGNSNIWDTGLAFSVLAGLNLTGDNNKGILIGAGSEYGLTVTNTTVQYLSIYLQVKYQL